MVTLHLCEIDKWYYNTGYHSAVDLQLPAIVDGRFCGKFYIFIDCLCLFFIFIFCFVLFIKIGDQETRFYNFELPHGADSLVKSLYFSVFFIQY